MPTRFFAPQLNIARNSFGIQRVGNTGINKLIFFKGIIKIYIWYKHFENRKRDRKLGKIDIWT